MTTDNKLRFSFDNETLSDYDIHIAHSPTFYLALEKTIQALRLPYVPIEAKRTLLQFIKFQLILEKDIPIEDDASALFLLKLQRKIETSQAYISKRDRLIMIQHFNKYRKIWFPDDPSNEDVEVQNFSESFNQLKDKIIESKSRYFVGGVYGTSTHPRIEKALIKASVHKWYIHDNPKKELICACGTSDVKEFKTAFRAEWEQHNPLLADFPSDKVSNLISYTQTGPVTYELP